MKGLKRQHWIIIVLFLSLIVFVGSRARQANSYMQQQIERLAREGHPGYEIYYCNYLTLSDYASFPCITLKARRAEAPIGIYGDGYHYIAVDFPWIPFMKPEHRI